MVCVRARSVWGGPHHLVEADDDLELDAEAEVDGEVACKLLAPCRDVVQGGPGEEGQHEHGGDRAGYDAARHARRVVARLAVRRRLALALDVEGVARARVDAQLAEGALEPVLTHGARLAAAAAARTLGGRAGRRVVGADRARVGAAAHVDGGGRVAVVAALER